MAYQFMPMYNIDFPVGIGERNNSRDVMLVQLLFMAYDHVRQFHRTVNTLCGLTPMMRAHGSFHVGMDNWIIAFQSTNRAMAQDGKILPIPSSGGTFVAITGGVSSTLAVLNYNALRAAPRAYRHIAERMQLTINTSFAPQGRSNPTAFGQLAIQRAISTP